MFFSFKPKFKFDCFFFVKEEAQNREIGIHAKEIIL